MPIMDDKWIKFQKLQDGRARRHAEAVKALTLEELNTLHSTLEGRRDPRYVTWRRRYNLIMHQPGPLPSPREAWYSIRSVVVHRRARELTEVEKAQAAYRTAVEKDRMAKSLARQARVEAAKLARKQAAEERKRVIAEQRAEYKAWLAEQDAIDKQHMKVMLSERRARLAALDE